MRIMFLNHSFVRHSASFGSSYQKAAQELCLTGYDLRIGLS